MRNHEILLVRRGIGASLRWTAIVAFFGLIHVWLLFISSELNLEKPYGWSEMIRNGDLVVLVMALVAAVTVDYFVPRSIKLDRSLEIALIIMSLIIVAIVGTVIFITLHTLESESIDMNAASSYQLGFFVYGILYILVVKSRLFHYHLKEIERSP